MRFAKGDHMKKKATVLAAIAVLLLIYLMPVAVHLMAKLSK